MTRARSLSQLANENVFSVDANNSRVGIGSTIPDVKLDVGGDLYADNLTINNLIGVAATFSGKVTYEDVTNVDSIGIITARSYVSIADSIVHTGDINTAIRFPAADTFTVETAGAEAIRVDNGQRLLIGATSSRAVAVDQSALQVQGTGGADSSLVVIRHSANINPPYIYLGKSRSATLGESAAVEEDDGLGFIRWAGADGTDANTFSAQIGAEVDGSVSGNTVPGRLIFSTAPAGTLIERLRINSSGNIGIGTDSPGRLLQVHNASSNPQVNIKSANGGTCELQFGDIADDVRGNIVYNCADDYLALHGYNNAERLRIDSSGRLLLGHTSNVNNHLQQIITTNGAALSFLNYQATDDGPEVTFIKSRNGTKGSHTVVNNGDFLGRIFFRGSDGNSYERGVEIAAQVDGTPGDGNMPGRLVVFTTPTSSSTPTERLRITADGKVRLPDNGNLTFGNADDMLMRHSGSDAVIENMVGHIYISNYTNDEDIYLRTDDGSGGIANYVICDGSSGAVILNHYGTEKFTTTSSGVEVTGTVSDSIGPLRRLGVNAQSGAYTLVAGDAGKAVTQSTNSAAVTVPNSVFTAGDMVTIINNTGTNINITQGAGVTMYNTADAATGTRTLAERGAATLLFTSASVAYISGSGLS